MSTDFQWVKSRLAADLRVLLDRAVGEFNRDLGGNYHWIKQPFGKILACPVGNVWFIHLGNGSRPPRFRTMAVAIHAEPRWWLPAERPADFEECCHLLGFQTEAQRHQFRDFLQPHSGRTLASTVPGAS